METALLKISIRQNAVLIPQTWITPTANPLFNESSAALVANAADLGFAFSEDLLQTLHAITPKNKLAILAVLKEITGVKKNWTPLIKQWQIPTGTSIRDHILTLFANAFKDRRGVKLACGHHIPHNTFPLERYNGCPFCGTPFEFKKLKTYRQASKLKYLQLWTEMDLQNFFRDLLQSKTALDATQQDSLKVLLKEITLPTDVTIKMKETMMLVIDQLIEFDRDAAAQVFFQTPNDILRFLWYKHTGFLQIIEPKTILARAVKNYINTFGSLKQKAKNQQEIQAKLKLKYDRKMCKRVAQWLNNLALTPEKACEIMHPKRGMWIRFIRALRLAEYSKRKGFQNLAKLLDLFYKKDYPVAAGQVNHYRLRYDAEKTFSILKKRPGLFTRSLFANMLWFGPELSLQHFKTVADQVPARLLFTLSMYAPIYFDHEAQRIVKPLGGTNKRIPTNPLLQLYSATQRKEMKDKIEELCLATMHQRFANVENKNQRIFIEEGLFNIPVSIGDRSETVQDLPCAIMGTRFPLQGEKIRLFMQWGVGLPAQHLDMDLSCQVAYKDRTDFCSYAQMTIPGCQHSGDIINIPNQIGAAEYIDLDVNALSYHKAEYVSFTCNAYSQGSISPNLVVGWMDSKNAMKISASSGNAYDPSCVTHQVKITQGLTKGLVFGVLDVAAREIIWLEMSFGGQVVQNLSHATIKALLAKLTSKLNIGNLLQLKAQAQGLVQVADKAEAEEVYDLNWASNTAAVTQLLVD